MHSQITVPFFKNCRTAIMADDHEHRKRELDYDDLLIEELLPRMWQVTISNPNEREPVCIQVPGYIKLEDLDRILSDIMQHDVVPGVNRAPRRGQFRFIRGPAAKTECITVLNKAFRESEDKRYAHTIQNTQAGCFSQITRAAQTDLLHARRRQAENILRHSPHCFPLQRGDASKLHDLDKDKVVEPTPHYPYSALCTRYPAQPKPTKCIIDRAVKRQDREDRRLLRYGTETRLKDMLSGGMPWEDKRVQQMNWTAMYGSSNLTWFSHRMKVICQSKESQMINHLTGKPYEQKGNFRIYMGKISAL